MNIKSEFINLIRRSMRRILFSIYKKSYKLLSGHKLGRLYPIKVINNFIFPFLKPDFADIQGHKMFLDLKDALGLSVRAYEPLETEFVKKEIKKGNVVLDLGAHIGYYTLIFAKLVGENGKVIAFEPDPDNFALLEKNVKVNDYQNVTLVQKVISNKTGKAKLYLSEVTPGHRIYNSVDSHQSIETETIRLDDYFKNYDGKIDFIKMDIEGAEGEAIQGMTSLLERNENVKIMTEFWPSGLEKSGIGPEECLRLPARQGFRLYYMNKQRKKIEPVNISELLEICPKKKKAVSLLFTKEELKNIKK